MRTCCALALLGCVLPAAVARADETFPYKAYVSSSEVYVRSGPGKNYYPTEKLTRGTEVEVYRHDPGGWYAIRPPQESFSWVAGSNLRPVPEGDKIAEVVGDRVVAYVGSKFSDVRDVRQVHLDRGEQVQIVGEKRFVADGSTKAETWYKVSPPAGEFRWVFGRFVTRQGAAPAPPVAERTRRRDSLRDRAATETGAASAAVATDESNGSAVRTAAFTVTDDTPAVRQAAAVAAEKKPRVAAAPRPARENDEAIAIPAAATAGAPAAKSLGSLQVELDDLNLKLSLMIAEEPTVWQFDALRGRAKAAAAAAGTALERGKANTVLREIDKYEAIRRQYVEMATLRQQTDRREQQLAETAAAAAEKIADPATDLSRFDGVGRLQPVSSKRPGAPRYALLDGTGGVVTFVTPAGDVSLQGYVGRVVGLSGIRQFIPELNKPHLTAQRLTELDPSVLR